MASIKLTNIHYRYRPGDPWILKDISLEITHGKTLVVGRTGSGKTTLLRIMAGLIPEIYGGELKGNVEISGRVGYVPQNFDAFILMPFVREELYYILENQGYSPSKVLQKTIEIADQLGIKHLLDRRVDTLSIGERQRVALASILLNKPDILLLDEPFAFLDPPSAVSLLKLLDKLDLKAIVIAEHRVDYLIEWADKVIVVDKGRIISQGDPVEALRNTPNHIPKPIYIRYGLRSWREFIRYVGSRKHMV